MIDFQIMISGQARGKQAYCRTSMTDNAARIFNLDVYKIKFLEALCELEDNDNHKFKRFPKTRLHRVKGVKQAVYRADIDKISGWRIHLQHINGILYLRDIIEGQKHDDIVKVIKKKKIRYR